jgi:hypothetical protein
VAGYEVGSAFLTIMPSAKGFGKALGSEIDAPLAAAGQRGGKAVGDGVAKGGKQSFVGAGKHLGGAFAGAFAAVGVVTAVSAVGDYISSAIGAASDLSETVNKSGAIFGDNAGQIEKWASTAAQSVGLSKAAALEAAAGFGNMFQQLGFAGDVAADMSTDVVQLSADLGSFNNLPTADVADRISAAFRGEYDSLQALIPNINAARVEQEALATTGKAAASELTAQEKAAAVLAIVHKDGAAAAGDFAKTSDGLANSQKILQADLENVKTEIGTALLPVALELFTAFRDTGVPILKDFAKWVTQNKDEIALFALGTVDATLMIVQAFLGLMEHTARMQSFWISVTKQMLDHWFTVVGGVIDAAATMFSWIPGVGPKILEVQKEFGKLRDDADTKFTQVKAAADKTVASFDAAQRGVQGIRDTINEIRDKTVSITVNAQGNAVQMFKDGSFRNVGSTLTARAGGGPVAAGRPYIVGEREAELFVPKTSGMIYNQSQLAAMGSGGGSKTTNLTVVNNDRPVRPADLVMAQRSLELLDPDW